ncbi:VanZ family protein [Ramlibacter henchirensis]|nr:VanZ family protein [Ramlibacter henchirensis]
MNLPVHRMARLAFWIAALAVLYFSVAPVGDREPLTGWDKGNHIAAFAALTISGLLGWTRWVPLVLAGLLGYGLFIELLQLLVPDHYFDLRDLAADFIGIAAGWCALEAARLAAARLR